MEDSAIVELYWQRSDRAIKESARKYGCYCEYIARSICGNREDAGARVNDTWLAAWNAMPDQRPKRLAAFLGCLTRHLAIDRVRAESSRKRGSGEMTLALDELSECLAAQTDPAREAEQRELEESVRKWLRSLNETERLVFLGRYYYLLSIPQIAGRFGYSESKTKSILFRLRCRLRSYLEKEGLL